jgi:hydrogenase maturation protein HypF
MSYLRDAEVAAVPALDAVPPDRRRVVEAMLAGRVNTVDTSSCGRLFDAVSAMLGIRLETTYEGQAAVELEAAAAAGIADRYPYAMDADTIDFRDTIRSIVRDESARAVRSARFHNTVSAAIAEACGRIRAADGLQAVCLSGGTFQNVLLLAHSAQLLRAASFRVFTHATVPPNDGGISLGQAVVASHRLR